MTGTQQLIYGVINEWYAFEWLPQTGPRHDDLKSFASTANGGCEMAFTRLAMKNQVPPTAWADTLSMSSSQEWMDDEIG